MSNQRGQYGDQYDRPAAPWTPVVRSGAVALESKRAITNVAVIGVGLAIGLVAWPQYRREKPLGVIGLGVSGSLVSSGIAGLLLDRVGMTIA